MRMTSFTRTCSRTPKRTHTLGYTHKPPNHANIHKRKHKHRRLRARARTHTHTQVHTYAYAYGYARAPLLYTHCSPLTRTPSFSSADDPMMKCGGLGLRGEMATPMRQGVWCLFIVSGTQCRAHSYPMQRPLPEGCHGFSNQLQ